MALGASSHCPFPGVSRRPPAAAHWESGRRILDIDRNILQCVGGVFGDDERVVFSASSFSGCHCEYGMLFLDVPITSLLQIRLVADSILHIGSSSCNPFHIARFTLWTTSQCHFRSNIRLCDWNRDRQAVRAEPSCKCIARVKRASGLRHHHSPNGFNQHLPPSRWCHGVIGCHHSKKRGLVLDACGDPGDSAHAGRGTAHQQHPTSISRLLVDTLQPVPSTRRGHRTGQERRAPHNPQFQ